MRRVLASADLPATEPSGPARRTWTQPVLRRVQVGGAEVLLVRLPDGRVVAFSAHCPHQGTPLGHATMFERGLRCPQHHYVYDLDTGQNILPTRDARPEVLWKLKPGHLPLHPVEERDGWIWVGEHPREPADAGPGDGPRSWRPPPQSEAPPQPSGPVAHPPETLSATVGDTLELRLPTRPVPGHVWAAEVSGDVVSVEGPSFHPDEEPVHYRFRLVARRAGEASVRCRYARPWGGPPKELRVFTIRVAASA